MITLFKVRMSDSAAENVSKTLMSGFITQGPKVEELEDLLWKELATDVRPITLNSCTSAIDLALELCNVGYGDEVISTPQTCFASQVGAIHRGATIRWCDIDPVSGLADPESIKNLITDKTKAIIVVDWAGRIADYKTIKSFGVPVIEDAAHCWNVFDAKDVERGDYIAYSLQAIKFLTSGDGGVLICPKDKEDDARRLRWFGLDRTKNESFRCTQNIQAAGFKYHMNDIAASIAIENIPCAKDSVVKHRENAKRYCESFSSIDYATVLPFDDNCSYWIYSIVLNEDIDRDSFVEYLKNNGIESSPVHFRNDLYDCTVGFSEGRLAGVDYFSEYQINIPVGWWLEDCDVEHIIKTVQGYK
jgi:dTDP-4-amino-4,6-dideoxygalactose transaminase